VIDVKPIIINKQNKKSNISDRHKSNNCNGDLTLIENEHKCSLNEKNNDNIVEPAILECGNCDKVFHQMPDFMMHISSEHNNVTADNMYEDIFQDNIYRDDEEKEKIPRPPNSFMIFGKERRKMLAQKYPQYSNKQISKILGQQWKSLTYESKRHYHCLAEEAVKLHRIKYPGLAYYLNCCVLNCLI
jgi:hypothetical protein